MSSELTVPVFARKCLAPISGWNSAGFSPVCKIYQKIRIVNTERDFIACLKRLKKVPVHLTVMMIIVYPSNICNISSENMCVSQITILFLQHLSAHSKSLTYYYDLSYRSQYGFP